MADVQKHRQQTSPEKKARKKRDWRTAKRKRNTGLTIRLSEEERAQIDEDAARAGMTPGAYGRLTMLNVQPTRQSRRTVANDNVAILSKYFGDLGRVGNNLNQIAHVMNIANKRGDFSKLPNQQTVQQELIKTLDLLKLVHADLREILGKG